MDKPLQSIDHIMWDVNHPTSLNVITGMMTLKGKIRRADILRIAEERILLFERFAEKVVLKNGHPSWERDEDFHISSHVHHIGLPEPGDYTALQALLSDLMCRALDERKPLWEVYLIDGYQGGSVIVWRLHHALADGIALIKVAFSITGASPEDSLASCSSEEPEEHEPAETPTLTERWSRLSHWGEDIYREAQHLWRNPEILKTNLKSTFESSLELGKLFLGKSVEGSNLLYKGKMSVIKTPSWTEIPLSLPGIKQLGRHYGVTVNDILLTLMTGAIRRHLMKHHRVPDNGLRIVAPVNLRRQGEAIRVENKIGMLSVELPVHLGHPEERLQFIREKTELLKNSFEPFITYSLLNLIADYLPKRLEKSLTELLGAKIGAVVTNVPGPKCPVYIAGAEVKDMMFWVPHTSTLGIGVSLLSYNNKAYLGVVTDAAVVQDPDNIINGFHHEYNYWRDLIGLDDQQNA
jgi:diacylglycerol O-acyltransferase / wax synthase